MINSPINVLVVEDNPGDYILVKEYLEETQIPATIFHADSIKSASDKLSEHAIDVVLLDLTLPDGMGADSFQAVYNKASQIPIIVLTGFVDTQMALDTLKLGAQ